MFRSLLKGKSQIFYILGVIALAIVTPTLQENVFQCDFDYSTCGYEISPAPPNTVKTNLKNKLDVDDKRVVTDYSSITEETSDGFPCKIPYTLENDPVERFFCNKESSCPTTNSSKLAKCREGRFFVVESGKIIDADVKFDMDFLTPKVNEPGMYKITLKYFAECTSKTKSDCPEIHDSFSIKVLTQRELFKVYVGDKLMKGWQSVEAFFNTTEKYQAVPIRLTHELHKKESDISMVYGIDNISIEPVAKPTEPTTPTTTTTSSSTPTSTKGNSDGTTNTTQPATTSPVTTSSTNASLTSTTKKPTTTNSSNGLPSFSLLGMIFISFSVMLALLN